MSRLPAKTRSLLVKAQRANAMKTRERHLGAALRSVKFPKGNAIPLPEELTPAQRALAEALCSDEDLRGGDHAIPSQPWCRRRWLGHERGGMLEQRIDVEDGDVPLWRALVLQWWDDRHEAEELMDAAREPLSFVPRLVLYGDLALGAYGLNADGMSWGKPDQIKRSPAIKAWAKAMFDRLAVQGDEPEIQTDSVLEPLFLAAVRNGVPIPPSLYRLMPVDSIPNKLVLELVQSLPEDARTPAVIAAIGPVVDDADLSVAFAVLARWPSAKLAQLVIDNSIEQDESQKSILGRLAKLGKSKPIVARTLAAYRGEIEPEIDPVELHTMAIERPKQAAALSAIQVKQLLRAAVDYYGSRRELAALFAGEHKLYNLELRSIADAKGKHVYDAWTYNGDSGKVFRADTTKVVASVIQFHASECAEPLAQGLQAALGERPAKKRKR